MNTTLRTNLSETQGYTAFVTGGTGFVGSHLVEHLLATGYSEVRCLVRSDPKYLSGLPIRTIQGSLNDREALKEGVADVDHVFHVAALTRAREWAAFEQVNILGTLSLLDVIQETNPDVRRVVVTSSLAAVGRADTPIADESTPLNPLTLYGRSKEEMERRIHDLEVAFPLVIIRPPAVYGPRETDILTFFRTLSRGFCPIVGTGNQAALSLVHVEDLVRGMVQAAHCPAAAGRTYFLGSPRYYSWHEIRDASATALDRRVITIRIPSVFLQPLGAIIEFIASLFDNYPPLNREKAREIRHACTMCNHSRASADFGYHPEKDLWDGIAETIAWYRREGWIPSPG